MTLESASECILTDMASCCGSDRAEELHSICPVSGTRGKRLELLTVKALLRESALVRVSVTEHHFCPDAKCDVVYFDAAGSTYRRDDVRVRVWEKELPGGRTICYCFGENEADIRREFEHCGTSDAVARVRAHIQAGRCACEIRNPRGVCCLGDVTAAVERVRQAAGELSR